MPGDAGHQRADGSGRIAAALTSLEALPIDLIGLNCGVGPDYMREAIRYLCEHAVPVTCIPNAGLPQNVDGQDFYSLEAEPMAKDLLASSASWGSTWWGCCGTTPEHIRLLVEGVAGRAPGSAWCPPCRPSPAPCAPSLRQDPAPLIVGERVNATGSRMAKRAVIKGDYDALLRIAREQVEGAPTPWTWPWPPRSAATRSTRCAPWSRSWPWPWKRPW